MRQISEYTRALLNQLSRPMGIAKLFGSHQKKTCELLSEIQECGEPAVIPYILNLMLSGNNKISEKAIMVMDALFRLLTVKDLIWFDQYIRQQTINRPYDNSPWAKLAPEDISFIKRYPHHQLSLLAILSFHHNGFIRQESVKRLGQMENGSEIPYLILRLNDWVGQVRETANKAISERVTPRYAESLILNSQLLAALSGFQRHDHSRYIEAVHSLLTKKELHGTLIKALRASDVYIRRECYKIGLTSDAPLLMEIIGQGIKDPDVMIRHWVIKALARIDDSVLLLRHLAKLENDPFMPNRREVLDIYRERFPDMADQKLRSALFDRHPSIRHDARYFLSKQMDIDFIEIYRSALAKADHVRRIGIISGIGETGDKNDSDLIVAYTRHQTAKIRKAAVRAIAMLSPENHRDLFQALIEDDSPRVSREAATALLQCRYQGIFPELWELFDRTDKSHIRKNILRIASRLSKWDNIRYLIEATGHPEEEIRQLGSAYLNRWLNNFNRSFTRPNKEQQSRITALLAEHSHTLGIQRRDTIEFYMKTFSS